ncbi:MAG: glycosyltransferase family 4 protein [Anaerolineae bacterium]|nr:glycosyltransferase family 4 protein [Anaerolineae bacterium]
MTRAADRPRVCMLLSNGYRPDLRVQKEAHTLALAGYRVTVIAWDRQRRFDPHEVESVPDALIAALADWPDRVAGDPCPVTITRVQVPAGYRTGRRLLRAIPLAWTRMLQEAARIRPDVVHAHDFDTLPAAYLYHRLAGVPLVYDSHEHYPGMVRANLGGRLSGTLEGLERWLVPRTDAVITVGERLAARFRAMGGRVSVVFNAQTLPDQPALDAMGRAKRWALGVPEDALLVVYVGVLTPDRLLTPLLEAVPRVENAWCVVGGEGPDLPAVHAAAAACDRIRALGWVPLDDVGAVVASADVVYYGLQVTNPSSVYFMPNLAFYALAAGRPLLTTPVGEIADVVQRENCGVVMDFPTPDATVEALGRLVDPAYRATLSARARFIGQAQYRWLPAATRLLAVYRAL